jgi:hypothetical protein
MEVRSQLHDAAALPRKKLRRYPVYRIPEAVESKLAVPTAEVTLFPWPVIILASFSQPLLLLLVMWLTMLYLPWNVLLRMSHHRVFDSVLKSTNCRVCHNAPRVPGSRFHTLQLQENYSLYRAGDCGKWNDT